MVDLLNCGSTSFSRNLYVLAIFLISNSLLLTSEVICRTLNINSLSSCDVFVTSSLNPAQSSPFGDTLKNDSSLAGSNFILLAFDIKKLIALLPLSSAKLVFKSTSPSGDAYELISIDNTLILDSSSMEDEIKSNISLISVSFVSLEVTLCFPFAKLITAVLVKEFVLTKLSPVKITLSSNSISKGVVVVPSAILGLVISNSLLPILAFTKTFSSASVIDF